MFGQAYPNWEPVYQNGESAIAPYDFGDPRGLPPWNYYASYSLPDDPNTFYRVEAADGSFIERFPQSDRPAWFSEDGSDPDPDLNPEYFITNPDPDYPHVEYIGNWPWDSPDDWHDGLYNGQTIQYHAPGSGANTATYKMIVATPGSYHVYSTWHPDPLVGGPGNALRAGDPLPVLSIAAGWGKCPAVGRACHRSSHARCPDRP